MVWYLGDEEEETWGGSRVGEEDGRSASVKNNCGIVFSVSTVSWSLTPNHQPLAFKIAIACSNEA